MSDELIAKLEASTEGSRELDADIARRIGTTVTVIPSGPIDYRTGLYIKRYTTSLDAKIPGENTTRMTICRGIYWAHNLTEDERLTVAYALTEPLARRIAAIKAMKE